MQWNAVKLLTSNGCLDIKVPSYQFYDHMASIWHDEFYSSSEENETELVTQCVNLTVQGHGIMGHLAHGNFTSTIKFFFSIYVDETLCKIAKKYLSGEHSLMLIMNYDISPSSCDIHVSLPSTISPVLTFQSFII